MHIRINRKLHFAFYITILFRSRSFTRILIMNKENLQKVIDHIRKHEQQFDMNTEARGEPIVIEGKYKMIDPNSCGTACCILGWTNAIANDFKPMEHKKFCDIDNAAKFLDLPRNFVHDICYPGSSGTPCNWGDIEEKFKPWADAEQLGVINIQSFPDKDCYLAPASAAVAVLEAIRDRTIYVPSVMKTDEE